ncbi:hypothetical protein GRW89_21225 [Pseudomonas moraviensis]|jgi:hypothetical protein|uniref:Uncharacterized protein n=1 Tax=Pseudomonas atacamensis TaxID=2565368 RepID=A0ABQ5PMV1_9PSED|nr:MULTISPECIES: hypothetical protein [Pseudomonas]MXI49033.1 hypothetical protein [Pseudomonas moraviensis]QSL86886.1 hypothetical protein JWU58_22350 [Pseudomonas atacamensis]UVL15207.1 hypothetical protein LOY27_04930 [Pseudomonas atacamensis]GLH44722.1 hypothetical protein RS3R1_38100 [Pseudomonas atacamensis]GLH56386.1 hypothetical protein RS3R6_45680 [Pseudomonas atacamensis]
MIFKCSGNAVNPSTVSYRSLGFGEAVTIKTQPYILQIKPGDFPRKFEIIADTFISECRIDDTVQGYADIPELATVDYPTFNELLNIHPNLAASLIEDYLYFELFYHLFQNPTNLQLVINNINNVYTEKDSIIITGDTYPFKYF